MKLLWMTDFSWNGPKDNLVSQGPKKNSRGEYRPIREREILPIRPESNCKQKGNLNISTLTKHKLLKQPGQIMGILIQMNFIIWENKNCSRETVPFNFHYVWKVIFCLFLWNLDNLCSYVGWHHGEKKMLLVFSLTLQSHPWDKGTVNHNSLSHRG
jgi:hypothetical protein